MDYVLGFGILIVVIAVAIALYKRNMRNDQSSGDSSGAGGSGRPTQKK